MRLKPLYNWDNDAGRQQILRYADDTELRRILSAFLLEYAQRAVHDQQGAILIRGAMEFLDSFLTFGDAKVTPKPPSFNLRGEQNAKA